MKHVDEKTLQFILNIIHSSSSHSFTFLFDFHVNSDPQGFSEILQILFLKFEFYNFSTNLDSF